MTEKAVRHRSIELFTGAGGLALGVAKAGFTHDAVIEWDRDACATLNENRSRIGLMRGWPVHECSVYDYDFTQHTNLALIAAGAPCQPWSLGGKHAGYYDDRNLFPEVFRAVRETLPPAVIIENVKGLLRSGFRDYFEYILLCLSAPQMVRRTDEAWFEHGARLHRALDRGAAKGVTYNVNWQLLNAADYGVPQRRERVFIVALRSDLGSDWKPLTATHSEDALLYAKWVDGTYWHDHGLKRQPIPERLKKRVAQVRVAAELFPLARWRTVRDALRGLPTPRDRQENPDYQNHVGNAGARSYPGHTGSPLDEPAKTLKAGDHGVPGGENMLREDDGSVRYFTVREAARLQTFPDDYVFSGAWSEGFRQLGNAVPVELAAVVANRVRLIIESSVSRGRSGVNAQVARSERDMINIG
jgi:DNA (cytosine-5)-methyltransferase 1